MVPQANPRTSNMVNPSAKTKEKQQVSVTTSLLAKDRIERTYYILSSKTLANWGSASSSVMPSPALIPASVAETVRKISDDKSP